MAVRNYICIHPQVKGRYPLVSQRINCPSPREKKKKRKKRKEKKLTMAPLPGKVRLVGPKVDLQDSWEGPSTLAGRRAHTEQEDRKHATTRHFAKGESQNQNLWVRFHEETDQRPGGTLEQTPW